MHSDFVMTVIVYFTSLLLMVSFYGSLTFDVNNNMMPILIAYHQNFTAVNIKLRRNMAIPSSHFILLPL